MAEAAQHDARPDLAEALRAAAVAGLIAFGLLLPLIGFNTVQNIRNDLVLETRWSLLAALIGVIAGSRFLHVFLIAPALAQYARRPPSPLVGRLRTVLGRFGIPAVIAFVLFYPLLAILLVGFGGSAKWIDNF